MEVTRVALFMLPLAFAVWRRVRSTLFVPAVPATRHRDAFLSRRPAGHRYRPAPGGPARGRTRHSSVGSLPGGRLADGSR
ncbi:hypothetical protein FAGKG844_490027 [Frankia sp. AgKG'84/4]